ncbi:hypothetical protein AB0M54_45085 [Actinoplanes sp. NPDC051470]|uniref:hypothetical protein n=1 Tax=Actinoplanes sp. NPDC051470 TaxID=3157224 RepID=UPI00342D30C7
MSIRVLVTLLMAVAAVAVGGAPAAAHGPVPGGDTVLAQTIAGMEVTLAVRRVGEVPGPLRVDLIPHTPVRALPIEVTVRSGTSAGATAGSFLFERDVARTYPLMLAVRDQGPHWLELRAGGEFSQLPFRVQVPRAPSDLWVSGAFGAAALLLFGAFGVAAAGSRAIAVVLGGGAGVALVVAGTLAMVSPALPGAETVPAGTGPAGRPYAQAWIYSMPARPAAGKDFTLRIVLVDGSTGRPLDDLVPHHQALAHVVVTSADGAIFRHVHPRRMAPGKLEVRLATPEPGPYVVNVEFERDSAGSQLVSGRFEVAGPGPVTSSVGRVVLPTTPREVFATRPVSIRIDSGPGRVQPWLGMAGHLIVRDSRGGFLGHAHELGSMDTDVAPPDDTVPAYDPTLRFAFTFPEPGRYFVWVQYARELRITTLPHVVDVRAGTA